MHSAVRVAAAGALIVSTLGLSGCFPLAATGVAVGTMVALDRRTLGAQTEDQAIELKARSQLGSALADAGGVSVTSFNRKVLLTGQVVSEQDKRNAERIVAGIENVRSVHNELQVLGRVSMTTAAADTSITARVKAALLDTPGVKANTVKVITEAGTVYLMGLVTRSEAERAAHAASRVSGVQRVVTAFELITDVQADELNGAAR